MKTIFIAIIIVFGLLFSFTAFCDDVKGSKSIIDENDKTDLRTLQATFIFSRHINDKFILMTSMAMGLRGKKIFYNDWDDLKRADKDLDYCGKLLYKTEKDFSRENLEKISDILTSVYSIHKRILLKLRSIT